MASVQAGQVKSGIYSDKDLPDYQAAIQHLRIHWRRLLSNTQLEILEAIIDRTARFGIRKRRIPTEWFYDGHEPKYETGYAGVAPITPVSGKVFREARAELVRLGILFRTSQTYAINYSIHVMHLAADEAVQKRVIHANKRGGILSTVDGLISWASGLITKWLRTSDERYTVRSNKTHVFEAKASHNTPSIFMERVRDYFMGNRSAKDILFAANTEVDTARNKVKHKQRTRRTLADMNNLFLSAWEKGQRERTRMVPPQRIANRDRHLLKTQILKPFQNTEIDIEDFAYWCAKHWDAIGATHFVKSKAYPDYPAFRWLVACLETYIQAYDQREYLDETATATRSDLQKRIKQAEHHEDALQSTATAYEGEADDLRRQLAEQQDENAKLRDERGLEPDADPVYARAIKQAGKKIVIGSYDEQPKRRIIRRKK